MRAAVKVAGVILLGGATGYLAIPACLFLNHHGCGWALYLLLLLALMGAAWEPTEQSRAMTRTVRAVMQRIGLSTKCAAILSRMEEAQLCRQLHDEQQLSLSRMSEWGDDFTREFGRELQVQAGGYRKADEALARIELMLERLSHNHRSVA
jgi:hypothetical protein